MARSRNIKPGFFTHEEIGHLSPLGRLLFIGLWCEADKAGRLQDRPKTLKVKILPYDNCNVEVLLVELTKAGFLQRYEREGIKIIQVVNFTKHQNPHPKEAASELPENGGNEPSRVITRQVLEKPERAGPSSFTSFPSDSLQSSSAPKLSPPVDKLGDKKREAFLKGKGEFRIMQMLNEADLMKAKKQAPGWDIYRLASIYESSVKRMGLPRDPPRAFAGWCAKYTKGRTP